MATPTFNSKDLTQRNLLVLENDYENEADETLTERLVGLTEMFPECIRNFSYEAAVKCKKGVKNLFSYSRSFAWIFFSSSTILFAPLLFELERVQLQTAQLNQQKQVLLGPNAALASSGGSLGPGISMISPR